MKDLKWLKKKMRKSSSKDVQKIQALIARNVKDIVSYEIKNENIGFMTITDVEVSSDHSYCKIYVSFLNNAKSSLETLNRAKGYVRSRLAKKVNLRRVPEISFVLDDTFEKVTEAYESRNHLIDRMRIDILRSIALHDLAFIHDRDSV